MKRRLINFLTIGVFFLFFFTGCKKEDPAECYCNTDNTFGKPIVETGEVDILASSFIITNGYISSDNGNTVTSKGICWSKNIDPTIDGEKTDEGPGATPFASRVNNLEPNTTYYYRVYATTKEGTGYGNTYLFKTPESVVDADGNEYETIQIGTQIWMMENLKTTKYNDGTPIPSGNYYKYQNNSELANIYGFLYPRSILENKLAPNGWHIPTNEEWNLLINHLGGEYVAGGKLKEEGTLHWNSPNTGATNESGFTALPAGYASSSFVTLKFNNLGSNTYWWSATNYDSYANYYYQLSNNNITISRDYSRDYSTDYYSVRCVKD